MKSGGFPNELRTHGPIFFPLTPHFEIPMSVHVISPDKETIVIFFIFGR